MRIPFFSSENKFEAVLARINNNREGNQVAKGHYEFNGTDTCETGFVYQTRSVFDLHPDHTLTGQCEYLSNEGNHHCPLIGTWQTDGWIEYTLTYSGMKFEFIGLLKNEICEGRFFWKSSDSATYANSQNCSKGIFEHRLQAKDDHPRPPQAVPSIDLQKEQTLPVFDNIIERLQTQRTGNHVEVGHYEFSGVDTCETGFVYSTTASLDLHSGGKLSGSMQYLSREGNYDCPITGSWNTDGWIEFELDYSGAIYFFAGLFKENISEGRFFCKNSAGSTYETSSINTRGVFKHNLTSKDDTPRVTIEKPIVKADASEGAVILQRLEEARQGNFVESGYCEFDGKDICESQFVYNSKAFFNLFPDGKLSGSVRYQSAEGGQSCPLLGSWTKDGWISYVLDYSSMRFQFTGLLTNELCEGQFFYVPFENGTFEQSPVTSRGVFKHLLTLKEDQPRVDPENLPSLNPSLPPCPNSVLPRLEAARIGNRVEAGHYEFNGSDTCESGFVYISKATYSLHPGGKITGTVNYQSGEGGYHCPLQGSWKEDGWIEYELDYAGMKYVFTGLFHGGSFEGVFFYKAAPNVTFADCGSSSRGTFNHSLHNSRPHVVSQLFSFVQGMVGYFFGN